jgi:hypothetical protein
MALVAVCVVGKRSARPWWVHVGVRRHLVVIVVGHAIEGERSELTGDSASKPVCGPVE